jgi:ribose transport system ATP-binding protein
MADRDSRVSIRNLSKTFPGMRALKNVDLDIYAGEIHALVGGNGSGKSTLIKILTGVYQADEGGLLRVGKQSVAGESVTPAFTRAAGIHVVHQDLGVFLDMSVMENIALGRGYEAAFATQIRWSALRKRTRRLLELFEIDATPDTPLTSLSHAARTQVAIARALQGEEEGGEGLLILDEPTSSLPRHEVQLLLSTLARYAEQGHAILYVSHRLEEVLDLANRVTVLRDGTKVGTFEAADLDEDALIDLIVGRQVDRVFPRMPAVRDKTPVLEMRSVSAGPLKDINLVLARGEVVGIGGLLGSGRTELLRAIFADLPVTSGTIVLNGALLSGQSLSDAMALGVAYVPENRIVDAAFPDLPVYENISVASLPKYWTRGKIANRRLRSDARVAMQEFLVKAASGDVMFSTLSGGNQQKVILARWLTRKPSLLLLDEPTQGVDVGARSEIYSLVRKAVADGASALLVASDFEELAHVADRVIVLNGGRIAGEVNPPDLTAERLMQVANQRTGALSNGR